MISLSCCQTEISNVACSPFPQISTIIQSAGKKGRLIHPTNIVESEFVARCPIDTITKRDIQDESEEDAIEKSQEDEVDFDISLLPSIYQMFCRKKG